mmetsp:Transcript_20389/g.56335  ORF Transcript_20389/g.56335 Transcript_20389/m.56335 type:complete len:163 (+) Transcript_20389:124-612(+)
MTRSASCRWAMRWSSSSRTLWRATPGQPAPGCWSRRTCGRRRSQRPPLAAAATGGAAGHGLCSQCLLCPRVWAKSGAQAPPWHKAHRLLDRVRVLNFPWTITWQRLREAFQALGEVLRVELDETRVGQAVVTFRSPAVARRAVEEYHRGTINGREILVRYED